MDDPKVLAGLFSFFGALIGSIVTQIGALLIERKRRLYELNSLKSALAAEVSATLEEINSHDFFTFVSNIVDALKNGKNFIPNLSIPGGEHPVYTGNIGKIGLLDSNAAAAVVIFYTIIDSIEGSFAKWREADTSSPSDYIEGELKSLKIAISYGQNFIELVANGREGRRTGLAGRLFRAMKPGNS